MVCISFLTINEEDAVELSGVLNQHRLLMFDTIEDHVDLLWAKDGPQRRHLTHLSGFTKALLCSNVERIAREVLGDRLVRMWAQPVTSFDAISTQELMAGLAKA
ncbi:MAG: hypothetical protein IPN62_01605 [Flavobacteriales bacterium]|nr:hypothetical protein [Flavobacteriales bacterium]HOZ40004.1 hypothetical protein [Flavobacteriales bacterium]